jgi:capsule polysaccharide modification protein KpsS
LQEGGASNEDIDDADENGNGNGVLSEWIIDELEKLCYYTADFEDIDDVINIEDFRLICCAAEEVDDLHQDEHSRSSEMTCQRILDSSVSHDDANEAVVVQHQSTENNSVDFLRDLPDAALQE